MAAEDLAEVVGGFESGGGGDLGNGHFGLEQQAARQFDPERAVVGGGRNREDHLELALELAGGITCGCRQFLDRERRFEIALHQADDADELGVARADGKGERRCLRGLGPSRRAVQTHVTDPDGKFVAVMAGDQIKHHVGRGRAAPAGHQRAVDLEDAGAWIMVLKKLAKAGLVFPMHGIASVSQQPGAGEREGSGADAAIGPAVDGVIPQPV